MPDPVAERNATFDVIVVGGGPAGSGAARLLASYGHSVALIVRARAGHALAESLPPSCVRLFDRFGIRELVDGAEFIRASGNTVQWAGAKRIERFDATTFGYQVPRDRFDQLLVDAARSAGATVMDNASVRHAERREGAWQVEYEQGSARFKLRGTWLLDCSGRAGVVARRGWRKPQTAARTTALVGVWDDARGWALDDYSHTLVESYDGGWAWSVPASSTRRYVTVMLDPTLIDVPGRDRLSDAYRTELARTEMLSALVQGATLVEAPWGCDASPYSATRVADEGVLLVGDAASFVDPLSSFGVKKALASAWLASVALHTSLLDSAMGSHAMALFGDREAAMYQHLQRQSASLARDAAGMHATNFWRGRVDAGVDEPSSELDISALRSDPRVHAAFAQLKELASIRLQASDSLRVADKPTVRGNRVVLEQHLTSPAIPDGVRYCRNIDLVIVADLAPSHHQVPDLFDAYNRVAPPAPLPDFLGALSTMIALDMLSLA